ncbi:dihydrolipoamide acetyltransferase family protein [Planctomicrobium sp. SH668]|uniref:dihydrolipoamide acetyltransferase family protein n=1 Tax=Planctomicrobium sp. SH668 TaxID=3448126 RepID=UPI003F5C86BD
MAFEIVIPRLGWSMEEGTFVGWLKQPGEVVQVGEPLFELEGEKAIQEVEAVDEGILFLPENAPAIGTTLPVGSVLAYLLSPGEAPPAVGAPSTPKPTQSEEVRKVQVVEQTQAVSPAVIDVAKVVPDLSAGGCGSPGAAGPAVRRMARKLGITVNELIGSGPGGRVFAEDLQRATHQAGGVAGEKRSTVQISVHASPRARRIAKELGIDWRTIPGSGAGGRVRERDVRENVQPRSDTRDSLIPGQIPKRRRVIAERMTASHQQTVPVTLTSRADASNLVNLREQIKAVGNAKAIPSYQDIITKLVASLLPQHPLLMTRWEGNSVVVPADDEIHIGIAVDTPDGLLVPVLKGPAIQSLPDLAEQSRELFNRVKAGQISGTDMQGSVFTISNLGAFGIDFFTPVINIPEAAILGLGAIRREAVVLNDGTIVAQHQISLSLTFDHRRLDGAPAARFLQALVNAIANPSAWLLNQ